MESVRPRPALERQVMRFHFAILLCIGGAILAPLSAFGHGGEFLLARLSLLSHREVRLEITADYGENPMISSAEEAQALIPEILRLLDGNKSQALSELGPGHFKKHNTPDPTAPIPVLPGEVSKSHELITGTWQWKATGENLRFEVPKGNPHNVLLWVTSEQTAHEPPRWNMLIAGDVSPVITLPQTSALDAKFVFTTLIACLGMGGIWWIRKKLALKCPTQTPAALL